ncbi:hypothetical protein AJ80_09910 [Polytolypa hystricis UAMH7299]|uniref:Uncharacterized protein n=1 Tax=Polytolypa hystricis (strain UAMH7299) TaxID=1447883 RepID=A0A2B7WGS5_POLH7|nr:hypothetical protein AJ80_09910 [Polytolypa hystricis UAMH7299]
MLRARIKPVSSSSRIGTTAAAPALAQPALTIGGDNVHEEVGDDDDEEDTEDLLSSFLPHLFPDETPPCLGDPGKSLVYESMVWGDVRVRVPDYPAAAQEGEGDKGCEGRETPQEEQRQEGGGGGGEGYNVEAGRRLFAHYLWGGGLVVAEGIERAEKALERRRDDDGDGLGKRGEEIGEGKEEEDDAMLWRVRGESVLEVGAG